MVMLSVDEQSQKNEFKKVVEPARIPGNKRDVLWFFDFSPDYLGWAFNDGVLE